jgi:hypothetical protein
MFVEVDYQGTGLVSFADFILLLKDMGAMLSYEECQTLARPYSLSPSSYLPPSAYPSSNLNHLDSFREVKLKGSITGRERVKPSFGDFLSNHNLEDLVEEREKKRRQKQEHVQEESERWKYEDYEMEDDTEIQYPLFVKELSEMLEDVLDRQGGISLSAAARLPWVLKEFELVDVLMSQLEAMNAVHRRKTLITLQYAFENADVKRVSFYLSGCLVCRSHLSLSLSLSLSVFHRPENSMDSLSLPP